MRAAWRRGQMDVIRDVAYEPKHGRYGLLDIWQPDVGAGAGVVVVMHGGGFRALSKERMDNVARFLADEGYVVVNVNYRLLPEHPFPAPIEDGLSACEWVLGGAHPALRAANDVGLALLGASAGGYMALVVGMLLGSPRIRGIVSISGPVCRREDAGNSPLSAPPIEFATSAAPPVLCVHSRNDRLVPPAHSSQIVGNLKALGADAELHLFDGLGEQHGIWRAEGASPALLPDLEATVARFLRRVLGKLRCVKPH